MADAVEFVRREAMTRTRDGQTRTLTFDVFTLSPLLKGEVVLVAYEVMVDLLEQDGWEKTGEEASPISGISQERKPRPNDQFNEGPSSQEVDYR